MDSRYIYYHCTKRKGKCSQPFNTTEQDLERQIVFGLSRIWLNDKTKERILTEWEKQRANEEDESSSAIQQLQAELKPVEEKLNRLLDGYVSGLIGSEEYQSMKEILLNKKLEIKQKLESLEQGKSGWFEPAKEVISVCNSVGKTAKEKDDEKLVEILEKADSNFILGNKNLNFEWQKPYDLLARKSPQPSKKFLTSSPFSSLSQLPYSFLFRKKSLEENWRKG